MDNYIQLDFSLESPAEAELLIAALSELGFEGFEEKGRQLLAFIPQPSFDESLLQELAFTRPYTITVIEPVNWNAAWEQSFEPVQVEDFCGIRASFHPPMDAVQYEIVITPKMSFGTGHHATTWLMIRFMKDLVWEGKQVLDFGTGTGVLAILAEKLGASGLLALDNDDWSIENAGENIAINESVAIELRQADTLEGIDRFDIILANINKVVILKELSSMKQHLTKNGVIIISGLLGSDRAEIEVAVQKSGLKVQQYREKDGWIALELTVFEPM